MYPHLIEMPLLLVAIVFGGVLGATLAGNAPRQKLILFGVLGAIAGGLIAALSPWRDRSFPIQSYGTMILAGFLTGVWMTARRAPRLGIEPKHVMDICVLGVLVGLLGSRALHVMMYWPKFNPFQEGAFNVAYILRMFYFWEGGLVFFGAFLTVIPMAFIYCKRFGLPALPFLDVAIPGLMAGQAFGRLGCFLNGCCYGKPSGEPWAVEFPPGSPPYLFQSDEGWILPNAAHSLAIHPTQIYAAIGAALTAAFLYAYWPRRPYDGFLISLALIMVGTMRFFEELLRTDEPALISAVPFMTIANWIAVALIAVGVVMMLVFRSRQQRFEPVPA